MNNDGWDYYQISLLLMREIEAQGTAEFVLLKNDSLREWWAEVKAVDRANEAEAARRVAEELDAAEMARLRTEVLSRLSSEEKRALGVDDTPTSAWPLADTEDDDKEIMPGVYGKIYKASDWVNNKNLRDKQSW